jgi:hypothetical protein
LAIHRRARQRALTAAANLLANHPAASSHAKMAAEPAPPTVPKVLVQSVQHATVARSSKIVQQKLMAIVLHTATAQPVQIALLAIVHHMATAQAAAVHLAIVHHMVTVQAAAARHTATAQVAIADQLGATAPVAAMQPRAKLQVDAQTTAATGSHALVDQAAMLATLVRVHLVSLATTPMTAHVAMATTVGPKVAATVVRHALGKTAVLAPVATTVHQTALPVHSKTVALTSVATPIVRHAPGKTVALAPAATTVAATALVSVQATTVARLAQHLATALLAATTALGKNVVQTVPTA